MRKFYLNRRLKLCLSKTFKSSHRSLTCNAVRILYKNEKQTCKEKFMIICKNYLLSC